MRILLVLCLIIVSAAGTFWYMAENGMIRNANVPWKPIDLRAEPGLFTGSKLSMLKGDFDGCQAALARSEIDYVAIGDREAGQCSLTEQVSLNQSLYPYSAPVRGTCPMVAALMIWENAVVKPAAERHFGQSVARIQHYGIFACRNIAGSSRRSQHATANAIDIAGLTLEDGTQISVLNDWDDEGAKGAFLRDLRDGACDLFRSVLGPDYNAAHADHFHLDMGPYGICR